MERDMIKYDEKHFLNTGRVEVTVGKLGRESQPSRKRDF